MVTVVEPSLSTVPFRTLTTDRTFVPGATLVVEVALLLATAESGVLDETDAVLEIVVPSGMPPKTVVTSVNTALAPVAKVARVQETVPAAPTAGVVHVQPAGAESDTKLSVALGKVSVRTGSTASLGP